MFHYKYEKGKKWTETTCGCGCYAAVDVHYILLHIFIVLLSLVLASGSAKLDGSRYLLVLFPRAGLALPFQKSGRGKSLINFQKNPVCCFRFASYNSLFQEHKE